MIVFIAPNRKIATNASKFIQKYDEQGKVDIGLLEKAVPVARKHESEGAEVFITR